MAWIRLEDTFPEHTKIDAAGGDAAWLHICGLGYCNRNRTDGFIPTGRVSRISDRKNPGTLAERLVTVGLWEVDPRGGYLIHDYLDYNPSKADLDKADSERTAKKAEAGKLGGIASGIARRKQNGKQTGSTSEANGEPNTNEIEAPSRPVPTRPGSDVNTSAETSSSERIGEDDDGGVRAWAAFEALADMRTAAKPRKNPEGYRRTIISNPWEHLEALHDLARSMPDASAKTIATAYESGQRAATTAPMPSGHERSCICEANNIVLADPNDEDSGYVPCPGRPDADVIELRPA